MSKFIIRNTRNRKFCPFSGYSFFLLTCFLHDARRRALRGGSACKRNGSLSVSGWLSRQSRDTTVLLLKIAGPIFFFSAIMSQAFVRENDDQWLDDVSPTLNALINFLTRENNGIRVYEKNSRIENGREVHEMSNGLSYAKDHRGRWQMA